MIGLSDDVAPRKLNNFWRSRLLETNRADGARSRFSHRIDGDFARTVAAKQLLQFTGGLATKMPLLTELEMAGNTTGPSLNHLREALQKIWRRELGVRKNGFIQVELRMIQPFVFTDI